MSECVVLVGFFPERHGEHDAFNRIHKRFVLRIFRSHQRGKETYIRDGAIGIYHVMDDDIVHVAVVDTREGRRTSFKYSQVCLPRFIA